MRSITARPFDRLRAGCFAFVAAATSALALLAAACGGGGEEAPTGEPTLTPGEQEISAVVVSSDLAVGQNRFALGLVDQAQQAEILGAQLHFRFFELDGDQATFKSEADATPIRITKTFTHTHEDGTIETHEAGETGVYVVSVEFDAAGDWGVEVTGSLDGQAIGPLRPGFQVRQKSLSVAAGDPAPRSVQPILSDVSDITEIDTSDPPNADMHNLTIADAVASGRPTVIVFATPAFCVSRICGPTKDVVDQLHEKYKAQANFIHVEPYDLDKARSGEALEVLPFITDEWGLQSEPWVFLVDSRGIVAAKFEAVVSYDELEAALKPLLDGAAGGS